MLGLGGGLTGVTVDWVVVICEEWRLSERENYWIWVGTSIGFVLVGISMCQFVSAAAEGSGIPPVRAILSGLYLKNMLSWWTYFGKLVGITAMLCSGLSLGKEGPFVHMASIIAANLPWRLVHGNNHTLRHQLLTAAIAVGVTATFGAPIGGVLFSIELTTHIYNIYNLWKAFFASFVAVILFKGLQFYNKVKLFDADGEHFYRSHSTIGLNAEAISYLVLSIILGLFGCLFIWLMKNFLTFK